MREGALRWVGVLWLASVPVGAAAATAGFFASGNTSTLREGMAPGVEPVLVGFWAVITLLLWGGRAVAAVVLMVRQEDLARSFLLLLGPVVAVANDIAAITRSGGVWWVVALAVLDLALVTAATAASYRPGANRVIAEKLRERARDLQPAPVPVGAARAAGPVNPYAIVALALAFAFPMLGPVFGVTARNQIRYSGEQGRGLALAGILVPLALLVLMGALFTTVLLVGPNTTP